MIEVIECRSHRARHRDGWSFPRDVETQIRQLTEGKSVCHLFGGKSKFGTRLDVDPSTRPDVIGDAWLPPFAKDSFDFVVMDPPYIGDGFRTMSNQKVRHLFAAAAWIARSGVFWFHPVWIESPTRCVLNRAWLVKVGRQCIVRCLQLFDCPASELKVPPVKVVQRGPALKYNRWLIQGNGFAFPESEAEA